MLASRGSLSVILEAAHVMVVNAHRTISPIAEDTHVPDLGVEQEGIELQM